MSRGGNIQGVAHLQNPLLFSYKKPRRVVQNEKNGHKNPNDSDDHHDENDDEIELYQSISNHIHYKIWDEITYPFLNFNRWSLGMDK